MKHLDLISIYSSIFLNLRVKKKKKRKEEKRKREWRWGRRNFAVTGPHMIILNQRIGGAQTKRRPLTENFTTPSLQTPKFSYLLFPFKFLHRSPMDLSTTWSALSSSSSSFHVSTTLITPFSLSLSLQPLNNGSYWNRLWSQSNLPQKLSHFDTSFHLFSFLSHSVSVFLCVFCFFLFSNLRSLSTPSG